MSRKPAEYDITIYKGRDFEETFTFTNSSGVALDFTSWSAKAQIRKAKERGSALIEKFTAAISTPPTGGEVVLSLTDTQTGKVEERTGYYDILLTNGSGFDETYVTGKITFDESVTAKRDLLSGTITIEIVVTGELGQ